MKLFIFTYIPWILLFRCYAFIIGSTKQSNEFSPKLRVHRIYPTLVGRWTIRLLIKKKKFISFSRLKSINCGMFKANIMLLKVIQKGDIISIEISSTKK